MKAPEEEPAILLFVITVLAFLVGLVVVPIVRRAAIAVGMVDKPDAHRKIHRGAVAVGGGVGVLLAAVISLGILTLRSDTLEDRAASQLVELSGLLGATILICAVGVVDDSRGLSGKAKLLGQTVAAILVVATLPPVEQLSIFGFSFELGLLTYPFAVLWILATINSVNLIDGMDGLASSVGVSIFAATAVIGLWTQHDAEGMVALAMAGSTLAFLVYNFYPATIFLGDTGAMLIGLIAGSLLLRVPSSDGVSLPILVPIAIMVIPFFDTAAAIIRRKFTGRSIYTTDRGHIHHVFRRNMRSVRWTMACIALLSVLAGLMAIASTILNNDFDIVALLGIVAVVGVLAGTRSFGHAEITLLTRRTKMFFASFLTPASRVSMGSDVRVQLQGDANWEELWDELSRTAQKLGLCRVRLDVNLPSMHEGYYAEWGVRGKRDAVWVAVVPLVINNRAIGRVELSGDRADNPSFQNWITTVAELFEQVELRVADLIQSRATPGKAVVVQLADSANGHTPKMSGKLLSESAISRGA